jgi:hypothetical protein
MKPEPMAKTIKPVKAYAEEMAKFHNDGDRWVVFEIPPGTQAHDMGYRFGCCRESERKNYEDGGAIFLDVQENKP